MLDPSSKRFSMLSDCLKELGVNFDSNDDSISFHSFEESDLKEKLFQVLIYLEQNYIDKN